jgi:hypothetical protein
MRKTVLLGALLTLTAATIFAPALLADDPKIKVHAEIVSRTEHVENHTDFRDSFGSDYKDNLNFGFYRARIGAHADVGDGLSAYIELQNHGNWGDSVPFPSNPQDPAISGLALTNVTNNDVQMYQAWIEWANIADSMVTVKLGRQEHVLGNELHMGDADFYAGQYFDGLNVGLDFETWDLDVFYYWVQERNTLPGSLEALGFPVNGGSDDETLSGISARVEIADGHNIEPYVLLFDQNNEIPGLAPPVLLLPKYNTMTIGFLYDRPEEHPSAMDWSLEYANQSGDFGQGPAEVDIDSNVLEGWFGYTFGEEDESHHRIHLGGVILGDGDDPEDIEAFIPLFPDTHRRLGKADVFSTLSTSFATQGFYTGGYLPFSSFHNITSYNVGWDWSDGGKMEAGIEYLMFEATEDFDSSLDDELGTEIDAYFERHWGDHLTSQFGVAAFSPGDAFKDETGNDDSVLRVWLQAKFRL